MSMQVLDKCCTAGMVSTWSFGAACGAITFEQLGGYIWLVLGIISFIFSIVFTGIKLWILIKKIIADGKVTSEELEELENEVNKSVEEIKKNVPKK